MAVYFRGILDAYAWAEQRHRPDAEGQLPSQQWPGWALLAERVGVQGDSPALRARQATKIAVAADQLNLQGSGVDWDGLERQLKGVLAGEVPLVDLPTTQEDLARQLAPRAIILSEQCAKKSRRRAGAATYSYMVVREGQEEQDGEWFTHEELKRQFPSTYREMLSDHQARKRLGEQGQQEVEQRAHVQAGAEGAAEGAAEDGSTTASDLPPPAAALQLPAEEAAAPAGAAGGRAGEAQGAGASNLASTGNPTENGASDAGGAAERATTRTADVAMSSAGKQPAPTAIPGASSVPRPQQPQPQALFQDERGSGPPASLVLAGVVSPAAGGGAKGGGGGRGKRSGSAAPAAAQPPVKCRPGRPPGPRSAAEVRAMMRPVGATRTEVHPAAMGITRVTTQVEPVITGRIVDRTVAAAEPAPPAGQATAAVVLAAPAGPGRGARQHPEVVRSPRQQQVQPQQQQQQAGGWTGPLAAAQPLPRSSPSPRQAQAGFAQPLPWPAAPLQCGWGHTAVPERRPAGAPPQPAAGGPRPALLDLLNRPAAAPRPASLASPRPAARQHGQPAALQPALQPAPQPQGAALDLTCVNPLLRRNAEYYYRTTGRLPPGLAPPKPPPPVQQQQGVGHLPQQEAQGLAALLQLLPKPRGTPALPQQPLRIRPVPTSPAAPQAQQQRQQQPGPPALGPAAFPHPSHLLEPAQQQQQARAPPVRAPRLEDAAGVALPPPTMEAEGGGLPQPTAAAAAPALPAAAAALAAQQPPRAVAVASEGQERPTRGAHPEEPQERGAVPAQPPQPAQQQQKPPPQQQQQQAQQQEQRAGAGFLGEPSGWSQDAAPDPQDLPGLRFMQRHIPGKAASPVGRRGQQQQQQQEPPAAEQQARAGPAEGAAAGSLQGTGEEAFYDAEEELYPQPTAGGAPLEGASGGAALEAAGGPELLPMSLALRTQPDDVLFTAADAAGLGLLGLGALTQPPEGPAPPPGATGPSEPEGPAALQELSGVPPTQVVLLEEEEGEEQQPLSMVAQVAQHAHQEVTVIPDTEEAEAEAARQQQEQEAAAAAAAEEEDRQALLEELLQPEAWATATIKGAKTRKQGVELWVEWGWNGGHTCQVMSSELLGREHCMASLIRFYESRTRQQAKRPSGAEGSGVGGLPAAAAGRGKEVQVGKGSRASRDEQVGKGSGASREEQSGASRATRERSKRSRGAGGATGGGQARSGVA